MRKSEVYSWRVSPAVKSELEEAARRAKEPVSKLLDRIVTEWLRQFDESADEEEQRRLHAAALKAIGTIRSGDPARASEVRGRVRQRLRARRDR